MEIQKGGFRNREDDLLWQISPRASVLLSRSLSFLRQYSFFPFAYGSTVCNFRTSIPLKDCFVFFMKYYSCLLYCIYNRSMYCIYLSVHSIFVRALNWNLKKMLLLVQTCCSYVHTCSLMNNKKTHIIWQPPPLLTTHTHTHAYF